MPFFPRRLLAAGCLVFLLMPQAAAAATLAENIRQAYAGINSMRADFSQQLLHKESGAKERRGGTLSFKKPLLVRWETKKPAPELLIIGKTAIWNVFPDEEMAAKYAPELLDGSAGIVRVITGQARLDEDFDLEDEGREGNLLTVRLYPKEADPSLVEVLLWIEPESHLIKKARIYDFYGNENEIEFTRRETGVALSDALFLYTPPPDFVVEDHSKDSAAAPARPFLQ